MPKHNCVYNTGVELVLTIVRTENSKIYKNSQLQYRHQYKVGLLFSASILETEFFNVNPLHGCKCHDCYTAVKVNIIKDEKLTGVVGYIRTCRASL